MKIQSQIVVTAHNVQELNQRIANKIGEGYQPLGSHTVVTIHEQKMFSGNDHKRTEYTHEYAQTMVIYK